MALRENLKKQLQNQNRKTYGTISQMNERLKTRKVFKVKVKLLQEVCRPHKIKLEKSLDALIAILRENNVIWHFDDTNGNVTHWREGFPGMQFVTDFDGFTEELTLPSTVQTATGDDIAGMDYLNFEVTSNECLQSHANDMQMNNDSTSTDIGIEYVQSPLHIEHRSIDPEKRNVGTAVASTFCGMNLDGDNNFPDFNLYGPIEDGDDTDTEEELYGDWSVYVERLSANQWRCTICEIVITRKQNLKNHIINTHLQHLRSRKACSTCGEHFIVENRAYHHHMQTKHIDVSDDLVIVEGDTDDDIFRLQSNFVASDVADSLLQIVFIPWINNTGDTIQLSIGWTKAANIVRYAANIWRCVTQALKHRRIRIQGCGSAVLASKHNIVMDPAGTFAPGLFMSGRTVANKVKGYCRDLVDSVRHNSANDVFGYLNAVEAHIIRKIKNSMKNNRMPLHNYNAFTATINNEPATLSLYNRRPFDIRFISSVLQFCGIEDEK